MQLKQSITSRRVAEALLPRGQQDLEHLVARTVSLLPLTVCLGSCDSHLLSPCDGGGVCLLGHLLLTVALALLGLGCGCLALSLMELRLHVGEGFVHFGV